MQQKQGQFPVVSVNDFPVVTPEEMRQVDELAEEDLGLNILQMMENAGRNLADYIRAFHGPGCRVCVFAGKGNNGGGGLAAARHLINRGHDVLLVLPTPAHYLRSAPLVQLRILNYIDTPRVDAWDESQFAGLPAALNEYDVLIDALLGYNLLGKPQENYATLIDMINAAAAPVIALDTPSGLDLRAGKQLNPTVKATATLTLAAPKTGLMRASAQEVTGDIYVADIGIPAQLWQPFGGQKANPFRDAPIVKLEI